MALGFTGAGVGFGQTQGFQGAALAFGAIGGLGKLAGAHQGVHALGGVFGGGAEGWVKVDIEAAVAFAVEEGASGD